MTIPAVWAATLILIILGPWENFELMLETGDMANWQEDSVKQATAIIYGVVLSFFHPFAFLLELVPLPWNISLVLLDVGIWLTALFVYQSYYFLRITVWYADLFYQLSVRMITQYDRTCAFLMSQWFDSLLIIFLAPLFLLAMIGDAFWYDTYDSRAVVNEVLQWTHTCNIDYYNDGPYSG